MRVLRVHNYYQQPGGEDISFRSEVELFRERGHDVRSEEFHNATIADRRSPIQTAQLAASTIWSRSAQRRLKQAIDEFQPDVAHFYNTFPLVSPAAYHTCQKANVPVVQTLANYRLLCPSATLYRDGHVCEECVGRKVAWPGIRHACYHGSRMTTATIAAMQTTHRLLGTWRNMVDVYIAQSENARDIFVRGGLPAASLVVKPNFLAPDPGVGSHTGNFALFVGRLSPEKGIDTLLSAWDLIPDGITLRIVGDGPLSGDVEAAARRNPNIEWLGRRPATETLDLMGEAALLVFTSEWHEPFGRTMVEAFARGTPVLAANIGAAASIVQPNETGLHYEPGNPEDLANKVAWMIERPDLLATLGARARSVYETEYTADRNYDQLLEIYQLAIARRSRGVAKDIVKHPAEPSSGSRTENKTGTP